VRYALAFGIDAKAVVAAATADTAATVADTLVPELIIAGSSPRHQGHGGRCQEAGWPMPAASRAARASRNSPSPPRHRGSLIAIGPGAAACGPTISASWPRLAEAVRVNCGKPLPPGSRIGQQLLASVHRALDGVGGLRR